MARRRFQLRCAASVITYIMTACWLVIVSGCSSDSGRASNSSRASGSTAGTANGRLGGRIVIGVQQEPERLSEILNATATNNLICNLIFSKFVKYDDRFQLVPDLIEAIPTVENGGISPDHLMYRYALRHDALWHDGVPVTSEDVEFTYRIIMDPDVNVESREGWDVIRSVDTPDPWTVVFHLREPYPDFVAETFYDEPVLPKHLLANETGSRFDRAPYHRAPIGSGPFVFSEWVPGSHLVLKRNDAYYGGGPLLDEVVFKFVPDDNALLLQLKAGDIDLYDNANPAFVDQAAAIPGIRVYTTPTLMYEHLDLNTENAILKDKRVRQAIAYATDRETISKKVYRGFATPAPLDEHPSSKYYDPAAAARVRFDPDEARRLLHEAGWTDSDGDGLLDKDGRPLRLTISATAGNPDRERTEVVLKELYRNVGIDLDIRNYGSAVLYGSYEDGGILKRGKFDIAMYAWLSSPEPATKASLYSEDDIPPNGLNHPRIRDRRLSDLLQRGSKELDTSRRIDIYHEVADILVDEMPVIPLFWYTTVDLCSGALQNYRPNPTQSSDTWNANTWYLDKTVPAGRSTPGSR
jgi:peptide/nickel transport system substrate-binding protein